MQSTPLLDFNKIEDLFFCIDVLTQARSAMHGSHPKLANNLGLITNSIMAFTEKLESSPPIAVQAREAPQPSRRHDLPQPGGAITDILTGEIISHGS